MGKNIKTSPVKLIGGAITALGAYDWGGKRKKAIAESQEEYDRMKKRFLGLDKINFTISDGVTTSDEKTIFITVK